MVDVDKQKDFPELVKKIRSGVNSAFIGEKVVRMRKTKAGRLLLEVKGDSSDVEAVRVKVFNSTGDTNMVRTLEQRTMLEKEDLVEWTKEVEVVDAVAADTGASRDTIKVIGLKKRYGGSQNAFVLAPAAMCRNVVTHGRMRVELVNCRIKLGEQKTRCFRCLSFGHISSQCQGPDRGQCCSGELDHRAAQCGAAYSVAKEFAKLLEDSTSNQATDSVGGCAAIEHSSVLKQQSHD